MNVQANSLAAKSPVFFCFFIKAVFRLFLRSWYLKHE
ncbi:hypothetical protein SRA_02526 [Streptococcus ratti FA-1 = DSM 20564]|uniref:Uncharacterized protein n=1 Tax=Streptococcus ratti FA-1 = DSM 20564 TaxID=699248 RepID=A0ABN0GSV8_STRRT|nr:hypothetical protein SRA_02526 [Streptococcus ratti FA-1 = DSM 20564]